MHTNIRHLATLALAASVASFAEAQSVSLNFNGGVATDWTSQFTQPATNSTQGFTWSSTLGIGSSGSGALTTGNNPSIIYNTAFSGTNNSFTLGAMVFSAALNTDGGSSGSFHLGLTNNLLGDVTANSASELFALRLEGNGANSGQLNWRLRTDTNSGSSNNNTTVTGGTGGGTVSFAGSTWYQISATFTKSLTPGNWTFDATITNFGANGTTPGSIASTWSGSFTQAGTYDAANLRALVNFRNGFGNVRFTALDQLSVTAIPEPSAFSALAGLGVLGCAATRRRRRS